jgi:23S rRNA (cytidine1920-2'-O)/16S rRNA (cytidine1409-2'-O)-methyltransferase
VAEPATPFVSRAGRKLAHALDAFGLDVRGLVCADFGCHVGGFTECLLRREANRVYAVDTGYGILDFSLRRREDVVVMERSNALHVEPPAGGVDLVTIDLAWTRQQRGLPAARRWLRAEGLVVSLVKPHYELEEAEKRELLIDGRLAAEHAAKVFERVTASLPALGFELLDQTRSPIPGGKSARAGRGVGNVEYLVLARVMRGVSGRARPEPEPPMTADGPTT